MPEEAAERFELYGLRADKAKLYEWYYTTSSREHARASRPLESRQKWRKQSGSQSRFRGHMASSLSRLYPKLKDNEKTSSVKALDSANTVSLLDRNWKAYSRRSSSRGWPAWIRRIIKVGTRC